MRNEREGGRRRERKGKKVFSIGCPQIDSNLYRDIIELVP